MGFDLLKISKNISKKSRNSLSFLIYGSALFLCLSCSDKEKNKLDKSSDGFLYEEIIGSDSLSSEIETNDYLTGSDDFDQKINYIVKYIGEGLYDNAIELLLQQESLLLNQESDINQDKLRNIYSYFGQCYLANKKFDLAVEYYNKAYYIALSLNDIKKQLSNLNDLSILFFRPEDINKKFETLQKAVFLIENNKSILDDPNLVYSVYFIYTNLSNYYVANQQHFVGKPYLLKAKKIIEEYSHVFSKREEIIFLSCEADYLIEEKKYDDAMNLYKKGLKMSEEINHLEYQAWFLNVMKKLYVTMGDYKKAYLHQTEEYRVDSTLFNRKSEDRIAELQTIHETDRLKSENEKKEAELEVQKNRNRLAWGLSGAGLLLAFGAAGFGYIVKKKNRIIEGKNEALEDANEQITYKNEELNQYNEELQVLNESISSANEKLEYQQNEIKSSITYASNIQSSLLYNDIQKHFPKSFVFYKPRDLVSGDFYFSKEIGGDKKMLAVADCTGHGVPGALLTIFGNVTINEFIEKAEKPSDIINRLDCKFNELYSQKKLNSIDDKKDIMTYDSMDIGCVFFDPKTKILEYSISSTPVFVLRNGELNKLSSDVRGDVGSLRKPANFDGYKTHEFQLIDGDEVFLFSDGMCDQFIANTNRKLGSKSFKIVLQKIATMPMTDRASYLQNFYDDIMTKNNGEKISQIDDMLLVGFKVE